MSDSINLVSGKSYQLEKKLKRLKIIRITAVTSLVFVSLISILLFIITIILPTSSVKKEQQQTLSNIGVLHNKLIKYSLIKDRIKNISDIMKKRKNYSLISNSLLSKAPSDLLIDALSIEDGTVIITVSAASLISINKFIDDIIILGDKGKVIKNVSIQNLILNINTKNYALTMKADIF